MAMVAGRSARTLDESCADAVPSARCEDVQEQPPKTNGERPGAERDARVEGAHEHPGCPTSTRNQSQSV